MRRNLFFKGEGPHNPLSKVADASFDAMRMGTEPSLVCRARMGCSHLAVVGESCVSKRA